MTSVADWAVENGGTLNALACVAAFWSVVVNAYAARWAPSPWRRIYQITAAYSAVYVLAWGWLVVHPHTDREEWSHIVTPVSLTSFIVVWSGFATLSAIINRRRQRALAALTADAATINDGC